MGYLDIENLYKNQDILMFKECYALEKIHGTSAHITFKSGRIAFFSGGSNYETFIKLFDSDKLVEKFMAMELGDTSITIYGEAYGGKLQGMSDTYGKNLKFIVFDINIGGKWLNVPKADKLASELGLEFVDWVLIPTDLHTLDHYRDLSSIQAIRNGCGDNHKREGIVIRPLEEMVKNNGERIIAKHKALEFRETKTPRVVTEEGFKALEEAKAIAEEWVTMERLNHILTSGEVEEKIENTGKIINLMIDDVIKESKGEIIDSPGARKEIGRASAIMFKQRLNNKLKE
jgi:hypothetical protein